MKFKWRKWNRVIHRDFGYFFFGMTLVYAISGIALNHKKDFNPNYRITNTEVNVELPPAGEGINETSVINILKGLNESENYKKYYFPRKNVLKVFLYGGSLEVDLLSGKGFLEKIEKRAVLWEVNFLHYNPVRWWTWFSDIFSAALILVAITGLFILKGKNGITGRGAWLTIAGLLIPLACLLIYS